MKIIFNVKMNLFMHVKTDSVESMNGKDVVVFLVNSDISTQKHPQLCQASI